MSFTGSVTSLLSCLDCAQKGAERHSPRTLINAHSPWLPAHYTSFPGLPRSRVLVSHLSILPENISTFEAQTYPGCREKRWTRICGRTHTHTRSAITLARACAARVLLGDAAYVALIERAHGQTNVKCFAGKMVYIPTQLF